KLHGQNLGHGKICGCMEGRKSCPVRIGIKRNPVEISEVQRIGGKWALGRNAIAKGRVRALPSENSFQQEMRNYIGVCQCLERVYRCGLPFFTIGNYRTAIYPEQRISNIRIITLE